MLDKASQQLIDMKRSLGAIWADDEEFQKLLDMVDGNRDAAYSYYPAEYLCQTIGCEMLGGWVGIRRGWEKDAVDGWMEDVRECVECTRPIIRCRHCWLKFCGVKNCAYCTGDALIYPRAIYHGHVDEPWDIDASGWYSNARRFLEELG